MTAPRRAWVRAALSPAGILVLAAAIRIALAVAFGNRVVFGDTTEYSDYATRLLAGIPPEPGTPRAPVYPMFMALGFVLGGVGNLAVVRLLDALVGVAIVAMTGSLARAIGGPAVGTLAMLIAATAPMLAFVSVMLYPTNVYTLLLLTLVLAVRRLAEKPGLAAAGLVGLTLPLGWMTDAVFVAPAAAAIAWAAFQSRRGGARLPLLLAALTLAAVLAGSYSRSVKRPAGGEGAFMRKVQSILWDVRHDSMFVGHRRIRIEPGSPKRLVPTAEFLARERELVRTRPLDYVHDYAWEFAHFFNPIPDRIQTANRLTRGVAPILIGIVLLPPLLLFPIGLLIGRAQLRDRLLLAGVVLATAAFYSFFFTQTRYRVPVNPYMFALAALALQALFPRFVAALFGPTDPPGNPS